MLHEMICSHRTLHLGPLMNLIQQGIDEGVFRPVNVEYTTYSLLGMINAFVIFQLYHNEANTSESNTHETNTSEDVAEHTLRLILGGLQIPAPV